MKQQFLSLEDYSFKLVLFSGIFLFLLKFFFSNKYLAILINSILEFIILFFLYILLYISKKFILKGNLIKEKIFLSSVYSLIVLNQVIFFINSVLFNDSLIMKYSINNFKLGELTYLFSDIIPIRHFILIPFFVLTIFLLARINLKKFKKIEPYLKYLFAFFLIFCIFTFFFGFNYISNIYASTIREEIFRDQGIEIRISTSNNESSFNTSFFSNQIKDYNKIDIPKNQKIILFVIEQTSYRTFVEDLKKIPKDKNFFEKVKPFSNVFTNYYTTNQDSMTSLWTMLNSEFIPFECYSSDWAKKYGYVLESNNLVDFLNTKSYETHMVSAVFLPGMIQDAHNWSKATFLKPNTNQSGFFCLNDYQFEPGCEDKIIIKEVKNILKRSQNKGLFLLQEFIYGHGENYLEKIHKTNTEYANDYISEIYDFLENESLLENTTIIVTADHGEKGYYEKELWNYQIPFIIINKNLKYKEINYLYSPLDFKDILLSYLQNKELKKGNGMQFFIGQTKSSEIGYIDSQNNYFLGKLSEENVLKLKSERGLTKENIIALLNTFIKWRQNSIERSSMKEYLCTNCESTMKKGLE